MIFVSTIQREDASTLATALVEALSPLSQCLVVKNCSIQGQYCPERGP